MIVMTRDREERICLDVGGMTWDQFVELQRECRAGRPIVVQVLGVRQDKRVRLGISAPEFVAVHRQEVYRHIRYQNQDKSGNAVVHSGARPERQTK